jgi:hypothetical protein
VGVRGLKFNTFPQVSEDYYLYRFISLVQREKLNIFGGFRPAHGLPAVGDGNKMQ